LQSAIGATPGDVSLDRWNLYDSLLLITLQLKAIASKGYLEVRDIAVAGIHDFKQNNFVSFRAENMKCRNIRSAHPKQTA